MAKKHFLFLFTALSLVLSLILIVPAKTKSRNSADQNSKVLESIFSNLNDGGYTKQIASDGKSVLVLSNFLPSPGNYFGIGMAAYNNSVAIGSPVVNFNIPQSFEGIVFDAVHIMDVSNGYLSCPPFVHPNSDTATGFGAAVAMDFGRIIIGAPGDDLGAENTGAVYLFDTKTGELLRTFNNPSPDSGDAFGQAVAIFGDRIVIGAPQDDSGAAVNAGAVYIFDANTGQPSRTLKSQTPDAGDQFGWAVFFMGSDVIVGAPGDDVKGNNSGAVYLFDAFSGNRKRILSSPSDHDTAFDNFGFSLSTFDNKLIVGAPNADVGSQNSGAAYLYDLTSPSENPVATFENAEPGLLDLFGWSVAGDASHVIVGAPYKEKNIDGFDQVVGAAYVFDAGTGQYLKKLEKPTPRSLDGFSFALTKSKNRILVGVPNDDTNVGDAGTVYNFPATTAQELATIEIPVVSALPGDMIEIPIRVSSNLRISLAQIVVDYKGDVLEFIGATSGAATGGCGIITQPNLPFPPSSAVGDKNILVQVSCGTAFSGQRQEVARLTFRAQGEIHDRSPLEIDNVPNHTFLTTEDARDIRGQDLGLINGLVKAERFVSLSGITRHCGTQQPVRFYMELYHPNLYRTSTVTDSLSGHYSFDNLLPNPVRLVLFSQENFESIRSAITGADLIRHKRHLAFLETLNSCQLKAADCTGDNSVTGADAVALADFLAFKSGQLTGRWNPSDLNFDLSANTTLDIEAALRGDINLSWRRLSPATVAKQTLVTGAEIKISGVHINSLTSDSLISVPIVFSSDSSISIIQVVIDYDSTLVEFDGVELSSATSGFAVVTNDTLRFSPTTPGSNKNALVQISSTNSVTGDSVVVFFLKMKGNCNNCTIPLHIDPTPGHTFLTTANSTDIIHPDLRITNGSILVPVTQQTIDESMPSVFSLSQNYPNPFNPETIIRYGIPTQASGGVKVSLRIYNLKGQLVRTVVDEEKHPGHHQILWDGRDEAGAEVATGLYIYAISAGDFSAAKKMLMLK